MRVLLFAAAITTAGLAVHAGAQDPIAPGTTSSTGSVIGRVVDADTGTPLPGVAIAATADREPPPGPRSGDLVVGRATTGADGRYTIGGLPAGRVRVFLASPYINVGLALPQVVTVAAGRTVSSADFRVRLEAYVSGRVTDDEGEPIPGVRVTAIGREYGTGSAPGQREYGSAHLWHIARAGATTDDRGHYTLRIPAGRSIWLFAHQPRDPATAVSNAPADPRDRRSALAAAYYPAASTFDAALPVTLRSLEHRERVDIVMRRTPSYCLDATLVLNGAPAAVSFRFVEEQTYRLQSRGTGYLPQTQRFGSGADGRIRICDLADGVYRLIAGEPRSLSAAAPGMLWANPLSATQFEVFGTAAVTIDGADVSAGEIHVQPPPEIRGEVVWAPGARAIDIPRPFWVRTSRPAFSAQISSIPSAFDFQAAGTVPYSFGAGGLPHPLYIDDITIDDRSILQDAFVAGVGPATRRMRVTIGSDGGAIRVEVRDRAGVAVGSIPVLVLDASAASEIALATGIVAAGQTGENGSFVAENLPPGAYAVLATHDLPPYVVGAPSGGAHIERSPEAMRQLLQMSAGAQRVTVRPNAQAEVSLQP